MKPPRQVLFALGVLSILGGSCFAKYTGKTGNVIRVIDAAFRH
jgi:hypothetical protein